MTVSRNWIVGGFLLFLTKLMFCCFEVAPAKPAYIIKTYTGEIQWRFRFVITAKLASSAQQQYAILQHEDSEPGRNLFVCSQNTAVMVAQRCFD